jgi:hypothetical protein
VAYRIQGLFLKQEPSEAAVSELERLHDYKLFELVGHRLWLLDLDLPDPKPGDRAAIRAARPLAPSYIDALRVLGSDEQPLEQAPWLIATAGVAKLFGQPALGFVSDDDRLDFAAVANPDGVSVIGDRLESHLLRWEAGTLVIQPYCGHGSDGQMPCAPEELSLIPGTTVLETEQLTDGYPLHGNVVAEAHSFAPNTEALGIGTWSFGPVGSLRLVAEQRMDGCVWDRATGGPGDQNRQQETQVIQTV